MEYILGNGANHGNELSAVLAMLWVFGLMACVTLSFLANGREETIEVNGIRVRIGIEIETLRNENALHAPNESIAHWLDKMKAEHGEKYVQAFVTQNRRARSEWRKTKKSRLEAVMRALPQSYKETNFTVFTERWSQGQTSPNTKVITDGSLSSGGFEVVSHPLVDGAHHPWLAIIGRLLRPITRINNTCGLHIHVGLRDPNTRFGELDEARGVRQMSRNDAECTAGKTVWAYTYFRQAFNKLVSGSRHHHQYCAPSGILNVYESSTEFKRTLQSYHCETHEFNESALQWNEHWEYIDEDYHEMGIVVKTTQVVTGKELYSKFYRYANDAGRYFHVNTQALLNRGPYGTIEFRQHQGTINPVKIGNWADLLHRFVTRCHDDVNFASIESYEPTLKGLWGFMDMPSDHQLVDYFTKRALVLNGQTLIHVCKDCGSDTCIQYECSVNDPITDALSENYFVDGGRGNCNWSCEDCGTSIEADDVDTEDNNGFGQPNAWCDCCECHCRVQSVRDIYSMSAVGLTLLTFAVSAPIVCAVALIVGCGIGAIHAGIHRFTGDTDQPFKGAVKRFQTMFGALAVRGGQASGFAWDNGEGVYYLKSPTSSVFLKNRAKEYLNKDTKWVIGHTRYATHGKNNAANAHPHFSDHVTLVHNGVVHNHDDVYKGLGIKPYGPVDTQAVVACLEVGGIEEVVKHCEGSMSLIWHDKRDPQGTLKFWTNGGNPLCFGRLDDPNTGKIVVCSTTDILSQSMGQRLVKQFSCVVGREYTIHPDGSYTKRDIEGSADTAYKTYDWRTYADSFSTGKSKSNKARKLNAKPNRKAKGNADNCAPEVQVQVPFDVFIEPYNFDDDVLNHALNEAWAKLAADGWDPIDEFHGFCAEYHSAKRPVKEWDPLLEEMVYETYHLPNYHQGEAFDPMYNTDHMVAVMNGLFDPQSYHDPMTDFYGEPMSLLHFSKDDSWDEQWS